QSPCADESAQFRTSSARPALLPENAACPPQSDDHPRTEQAFRTAQPLRSPPCGNTTANDRADSWSPAAAARRSDPEYRPAPGALAIRPGPYVESAPGGKRPAMSRDRAGTILCWD